MPTAIAELLTRPELAPILWRSVLGLTPQKRCVICKAKQALSMFNRKTRAKDGLQPACKRCNKIASRKYYRRRRTKHLDVVKRQKAARRHQARVFSLFYLMNHPCVDCGEQDPVVLDFDHVRGDKRSNVGGLIVGGYSLKVIALEIAKCQVRCANCHRRRTAKHFGWWKYEVTRALSKLKE